MSDPSVRDYVRGFTDGGEATNTESVIYKILSSNRLLTCGRSGDLPRGARVILLPFDADGAGHSTPAGTVSLVIEYPFGLLDIRNNNQAQQPQVLSVPLLSCPSASMPTKTVSFPDFTIIYQATVPLEVYQEVN